MMHVRRTALLAVSLATLAGSLDGETRLRFVDLQGIRFSPAKAPSTDYSGTLRKGSDLKGALPETVLSLDGEDIAIRGFMYPLEYDIGYAREFLFMPFDMTCHLGDWPGLAEFMIVKMEGDEGAKVFLHDPVTLHGTLRIEERWEFGMATGLLYVEGTKTVFRE